jgi:hypothetical protein
MADFRVHLVLSPATAAARSRLFQEFSREQSIRAFAGHDHAVAEIAITQHQADGVVTLTEEVPRAT